MTRLKTSSVFLKSSRFNADWVKTINFFSSSSNLKLVLLRRRIPISFEERSTAIDFVNFVSTHMSRSSFRKEYPSISSLSILSNYTQLATEEFMVTLCIDFLQTCNVGVIIQQFVEYQFLSIIPCQRVLWSVSVHVIRRISFAKNVVT